jgi:hypothetical protein
VRVKRFEYFCHDGAYVGYVEQAALGGVHHSIQLVEMVR